MDSELIEQVTLNQNSFNFGLVIGDGSSNYRLGYEDVSQLCFYSDVTTGEFVLTFVYNDKSASSLTLIEDVSTSLIEFYFDVNDENKDKSIQPIDLFFIVDKIMHKDGELSNHVYQVKATLAQSQILRKNVEFSFSDLNPEDAMIKLYKSADVEMKSLSKIGQPSAKIGLIFDTNANLWEATSQLIEFLSSYENGIYLTRYNIFENTYELIPFGKRQFGSDRSHTFMIPSQDGISDYTNNQVIKITPVPKKISASKADEFVEDIDFPVFDSKTRTWKTTTKKYEDSQKSLLLDKNVMIFQKQQIQQQREFSHKEIYNPNFARTFGKRNLNMFYFGDTIEVEVLGDTRVLAGDVAGLTSNNDNLTYKFGGVWCIASAYHWIQKNEYKIKMILSRPFKPEKQDQ